MGPAEIWPYGRKDHISEDHITGTDCMWKERIPSVTLISSLLCIKDRPYSRSSRSPWSCRTFTTSLLICPSFPLRLEAPRNHRVDIGLLQSGRTNQRCLSSWSSRRVWSKAVSSELATELTLMSAPSLGLWWRLHLRGETSGGVERTPDIQIVSH